MQYAGWPAALSARACGVDSSARVSTSAEKVNMVKRTAPHLCIHDAMHAPAVCGRLRLDSTLRASPLHVIP